MNAKADGVPRIRDPRSRSLPVLILFVGIEEARLLLSSFGESRVPIATDLEGAIRMLGSREGELRRPCPRWIPVRDKHKVLLVATDEVEWIEACRNEVNLHWKGKCLALRRTISQMEAMLDPSQFVRIHRNAIVRTDFILEVVPWFKGRQIVALRDGTKLPSTRRRWNPFREWTDETRSASPGPESDRASENRGDAIQKPGITTEKTDRKFGTWNGGQR